MSFRPPDDIQIAALNKKQAAIRDPMLPGAGTPWEDRGSVGVVGGFFKTLGQSLFAPAKLLSSIRRPETFADAKVFAIVCGVFWGIGLVVQSSLWLHGAEHDYRLDTTRYHVGQLIEFVGAIVYTLVGINLFSTLFLKMVVMELKGRNVPQILMQNLTAYTLGPAILSVIPVAGPALAGVWTFVNLIIAGTNRLQLKVYSTVIAVLLSSLAVGGLAVLLHFGGWWLFNYITSAYVPLKPGESFLGM